jgi:threonine/homoserine/homoserine lactone efflux protein
LDIGGFALAVLLIELTPGPNMAWLPGLAATEGRRGGLAAAAGVALGLLATGILAALGQIGYPTRGAPRPFGACLR